MILRFKYIELAESVYNDMREEFNWHTKCKNAPIIDLDAQKTFSNKPLFDPFSGKKVLKIYLVFVVCNFVWEKETFNDDHQYALDTDQHV